MKLIHYLWPLPFISFSFGYLLLAYVCPADTIKTPSIVGITLQQALPILSSQNINIRLLVFKQETELPDGTILSQTPAANTPIKANQAVYLVLSQKPPQTLAPLLINKSADNIEKELKSKSIRHKTHLLQSNHPAKQCIGQYPTPGTPLDEKKIITYVSSGKHRPILLPNFRQKSISVVTEFLDTYSMKYTLSHQWLPQPTLASTAHVCTQACIVSDQRPLAYSIIDHSQDRPIQVHLQVRHQI